MNRSTRLAAAVAALFAGGAYAQTSPSASAQTSNVSDDVSLAAINVTAKGYAAADAETPIAATVLTREALAHKQAQNVGEALRGEPGLSVMLDSAQGQNPIIRGLGKDSVVLLVDGMRLNSAQPFILTRIPQ